MALAASSVRQVANSFNPVQVVKPRFPQSITTTNFESFVMHGFMDYTSPEIELIHTNALMILLASYDHKLCLIINSLTILSSSELQLQTVAN